MAESTSRAPMEVTVSRARKKDFVQIGDQVFNRRKIVRLSKAGMHKTVVHTAKHDFPVDIRIALAAEALGIGDFDGAF